MNTNPIMVTLSIEFTGKAHKYKTVLSFDKKIKSICKEFEKKGLIKSANMEISWTPPLESPLEII